ncbi:hypothetical protein BgiBS90_017465 [Biomphalaria glabrata]|nr:hypothetical protein BgiBS90_017465 [Biomphalaria glabrata]
MRKPQTLSLLIVALTVRLQSSKNTGHDGTNTRTKEKQSQILTNSLSKQLQSSHLNHHKQIYLAKVFYFDRLLDDLDLEKKRSILLLFFLEKAMAYVLLAQTTTEVQTLKTLHCIYPHFPINAIV